MYYIADCIENEKQQKYVPILGATIFPQISILNLIITKNWKHFIFLPNNLITGEKVMWPEIERIL